MEYRDTSIRLKRPDENGNPIEKTFPGKEAIGTGLGYWIGDADEPGERTFYALTHIPSGYKIPMPFIYDEKIAQQIIEQMAPLINWNRPLETLISDPEYTQAIPIVQKILDEACFEHVESMGFVTPDGRIWSV